MIQDDKFLVQKQEEVPNTTTDALAVKNLKPRDYFVLRRGDVLAISTLRSYANNAMIMLELEQAGKLELSYEEHVHLNNLAVYASELADEWEQDQNLKLPD